MFVWLFAAMRNCADKIERAFPHSGGRRVYTDLGIIANSVMRQP